MSRQDYVSQCKRIVAETLKPGQSLIRYFRKPSNKFVKVKDNLYRRETGKPIGVVVIFKDQTTKQIKLGYSLCHKNDIFNKAIGLAKAVENAIPNWMEDFGKSEVPGKPAFKQLVDQQRERAQRFFKGK